MDYDGVTSGYRDMDGGPVAAIVRLPDFDRNFGRFVKVFERLEKPLTFLIWGVGASSLLFGIGALKYSFRRSSSDSSRRDKDKDRDRDGKDKSRKERKERDTISPSQ